MSGSTNFGVLLLMVGIAGLLIELAHPGVRVAGLVGVVALVVGALYVAHVELPRVDIAPELVVASGVVLTILCILAVQAGIRVRHIPVVTGVRRVIGAEGIVIAPFAPDGQVRVRGETWTARLGRGSGPPAVGDTVKVVAVRGLTLEVVPVSSEVT